MESSSSSKKKRQGPVNPIVAELLVLSSIGGVGYLASKKEGGQIAEAIGDAVKKVAEKIK